MESRRVCMQQLQVLIIVTRRRPLPAGYAYWGLDLSNAASTKCELVLRAAKRGRQTLLWLEVGIELSLLST